MAFNLQFLNREVLISTEREGGYMKAYKFCIRAVCISIIASLQLLGLSQEATASIIVQLDSVAPDLVYPGNYRWTFSASASSTDGFRNDGEDYFTIYDLPGSIFTVEANALYWQASSSLTGETPLGLTPTDDPSKSNVTFTYSDNSNRPGNAAFQLGDHFDIILTVNTPVNLEYSWQDYSAYPIVNNPLQSGLGRIVQGNVPEPSTIGLIGLGLAGLGISRRKRVS